MDRTGGPGPTPSVARRDVLALTGAVAAAAVPTVAARALATAAGLLVGAGSVSSSGKEERAARRVVVDASLPLLGGDR